MNVAQAILDAIPETIAFVWNGVVATYQANPGVFLLVAAIFVVGSLLPVASRTR